MQKRINISLPEETVGLMDRVTDNRSELIDHAVRAFVAKRTRTNLHKLLKEAALDRADRDLALTAEWFNVDNEAWPGKREK